MDWVGGGQLLGYAGTASMLAASCSLALRQRTSRAYWALVVAGNLLWLSAGIKMGAAAVVVDALIFAPSTALGIWRYLGGER